MMQESKPQNAQQKDIHTVLVVDDHPLFRRGVCELLALEPTIRVVGEAGTREEALELVRKCEPDLTVLDLNIKGSSGVEILTKEPERFLESLKETLEGRLIVDQSMVRYLTDLIRVKKVDVEPVRLTDREEDVLALIERGFTNKMIARELHISDGTVKGHVKHLLKKLGFQSRVEAAVWASQRKSARQR